MAHRLHALASDIPLSDTELEAKAIAVYCEICGILVAEFASLVHRDPEKETCGAWSQGGLPEHVAGLMEPVGGNVTPLCANTYNIVTSSFGMQTTLTSGTICVPGREAPVCVHGCGDMEEQCQKATVVVVAQRDGYGSGGHFHGAVFDHTLQVASFCTLHGMMSMLPCRTAPVGWFRVRQLQLGVGGMRGHIIATNFRCTRLVR